MAALISFIFFTYFLCFSLLCSSNEGHAFEGRKIAESNHLQHSHAIQVSSLFPADSCKPSAKELDKETSLRVIHKHGPCSAQNQQKEDALTANDVLIQDQSRVRSIRARVSYNLARSSDRSQVLATDSATLPAKDGRIVASGNYIVTVGLGTPRKELSLVFDTGSDLTWTQCEPCVKYCYQQKEPKFNPSLSKSYSNISCASSMCNSLTSATGNSPSCASASCVYGIQYGDNSFSVGFLGTETVTLTSTDVFDNFYFGCGQNNRGLFGGAAGLLGLGRDKLSFVSQTAHKYGKVFSYCLPSTSSSTGFLSFGSSVSHTAKFTPLSKISDDASFYGIDFTGISVGGRKLPISSTVFSTAGTIIDSGTVITRLPPSAYSSLRSVFRQSMTKYPTAQALSILDTCYDFSSYKTISVPKIKLFFNGEVEVDLDITGIFYVNGPSQVCLAFAGNSDPTDVAIFGNVQQKTIEVVYDANAGKVGFAPGGCR